MNFENLYFVLKWHKYIYINMLHVTKCNKKREYIILSGLMFWFYSSSILCRGVLYPGLYPLHPDRQVDAGSRAVQAVAGHRLSALLGICLQHCAHQLWPFPLCHQSGEWNMLFLNILESARWISASGSRHGWFKVDLKSLHSPGFLWKMRPQ